MEPCGGCQLQRTASIPACPRAQSFLHTGVPPLQTSDAIDRFVDARPTGARTSPPQTSAMIVAALDLHCPLQTIGRSSTGGPRPRGASGPLTLCSATRKTVAGRLSDQQPGRSARAMDPAQPVFLKRKPHLPNTFRKRSRATAR